MSIAEVAWPALTGLAVTFAVSALIAVTRRWHGRLTLDTQPGPQKVHGAPIPRIGGGAVYVGLLAAAAVADSPARWLLLFLGASSLFGFVAGTMEDVFKKVRPALRLLATLLSGLTFCILADYSVTRLDIPFIDGFMSLPLISIGFTVFVMAGLAHAVNIIDGFHGLAAGTVIIMTCAIGIVAFLAEDHDLALAAIVVAAVLAGFLLINFPFGYVFLGDGGAYLSGLILGGLAVMLAERNPGVSAWTIAVILAYPVIETLFSIARKTVQSGNAPSRPDEMHLHMLVYRSLARKFTGRLGHSPLANPLTGAVLWAGAAVGLVFVALPSHARDWGFPVFALQGVVYLAFYYGARRFDHASPDRSRAGDAQGPRPEGRTEVGRRMGEGVSRSAACGSTLPARPGRGRRP